jgi:hypothetical protein
VVVVFCLDDGKRDVGFVGENVIGPFRFPTRHERTRNDNRSLGEKNFLADLHHFVPSRLLDGRGYEFGANIPFCKFLPVSHGNLCYTISGCLE